MQAPTWLRLPGLKQPKEDVVVYVGANGVELRIARPQADVLRYEGGAVAINGVEPRICRQRRSPLYGKRLWLASGAETIPWPSVVRKIGEKSKTELKRQGWRPILVKVKKDVTEDVQIDGVCIAWPTVELAEDEPDDEDKTKIKPRITPKYLDDAVDSSDYEAWLAKKGTMSLFERLVMLGAGAFLGVIATFILLRFIMPRLTSAAATPNPEDVKTAALLFLGSAGTIRRAFHRGVA
ncbi:MAG TPA: hypothetical protein VI818_04325 [Candidatus Thermoplasmatota archaeon]|nr:hypothetical protein [Candidatus Thermoplasmatota archaeon]